MLHRPTAVIADLNGNEESLIRTLIALDLVDGNGDWKRERMDLVQLGDIFGDRHMGSVAIARRLCILREQIMESGGELSLIIGNHDFYSLMCLSGAYFPSTEFQWKGLYELFELVEGRPAQDFAEIKSTFYLKTQGQKARVSALTQNGDADELLHVIKSFRLFDQFGDTLFMHTQPSKEILSELAERNGDMMNLKFQAGLQAWLSGEQVFSEELQAYNPS